MARWAVFDIDGTLLPGASIEARFLIRFRKEVRIPYRNWLAYFLKGMLSLLSLPLSGTGNWLDGFKSNKIFLRGFLAQSVREFAQKFLEKHVIPLLSAEGLQTVETYRQRDYKIMLMSGSLDFLVESMREVYHPDYVVCTELEITSEPNASGRYTGRIVGLHPMGMRKRKILSNLQKELDIDFSNSVVFANHHIDVHHMELFGGAVAVNPTPKLHNIAQKRSWRIERWE